MPRARAVPFPPTCVLNGDWPPRHSHINDHIMGGMQAFYTVFGADDDELLSYYFDDEMMGEVRARKTRSPAAPR